MNKFTDDQEERLCHALESMAAMAHTLYECCDDRYKQDLAGFILLIRKEIMEATELTYIEI